jgi:hypothetical protein
VFNIVHFIAAPVLLSLIPSYNFTLQQNSKFVYNNLRPPPNIQKQRLHILYGVFLI